MNLIAILEQEEIARLTGGKAMPAFAPGDTVVVSVNVVEGTRKRVQAFEGVVIAKRNRGLNSAFTVRKISSAKPWNACVQLYSPQIAGIEVKRRGDVRRAKLYYLRNRSGKSARIKEKLVSKPRRLDRLSAHGPICVGRSRFPAFSSDTDFRLKGTCEGAFFFSQSRMSDSSSSRGPGGAGPSGFDPASQPWVVANDSLPAVPACLLTRALRGTLSQPSTWKLELSRDNDLRYPGREGTPVPAAVLIPW